MKIVSWNIAGGHVLTEKVKDATNYDIEDLDYFIEELKKVNPDIICLQEAHTSVDGKELQAGIIADKLGYPFVENQPYNARESHIKKDYFISVATISKLPIAKSYFFELPNPNFSVTRPNGDKWITLNVGLLITEINYGRRKINVANIHLLPLHYFGRDYMELEFKNIRESISRLLIDLLKNPTIAIGDFNFPDLRKMIPKLFEDGRYETVFENTDTTPAKGQQDHILFSKALNLKKYEIKKLNADHYLCLADIDFK